MLAGGSSCSDFILGPLTPLEVAVPPELGTPLLYWGMAVPPELGIPLPQVDKKINKLSNYVLLF